MWFNKSLNTKKFTIMDTCMIYNVLRFDIFDGKDYISLKLTGGSSWEIQINKAIHVYSLKILAFKRP